jgi:hypothetical protein
VLALGVALLLILPAAPAIENVAGFATPVIAFELASSPEDVTGILGAPGTAERRENARRMMLGTWVDFFFALAYAGLYVGIARLAGARMGMPRSLVTVVAGLAAIMAVADGLENVELLRLAGSPDAGGMTGAFERLRIFTLTKWYAIFLASGVLAPFIWRDVGWWRFAALPFGSAAALGVLSLRYLPAIEHGSIALFAAWTMAYVRAFVR